MTFSLTLSVGDVHFKLIPKPTTTTTTTSSSAPTSLVAPAWPSYSTTSGGPSSSSSSSSSPIVSVRLRPKATPAGRKLNGTDENDTAASARDNIDDNDKNRQREKEEEFDVIADLSQFSGTLYISSSSAAAATASAAAGGGEKIPSNTTIYPLPKEEEESTLFSEERTPVQPSHNDIETNIVPILPTEEISNEMNEQRNKHIMSDVFVDDEEIKQEEEEETQEENSKVTIQDLSFIEYCEENNTESQDMDDSNILAQYEDNSIGSEEQKRAVLLSIKSSRSCWNRPDITRRPALHAFTTERILSTQSTGLHLACSSRDIPISTLRSMLEANPEYASKRDAFGDMPIHLFARNEELALSEEIENAENFVEDLLKIAPQSVVISSQHDGYIPFLSAVVHWLEDAYKDRDETLAKDSVVALLESRRRSGLTSSKSFKNLSQEEQCLMFLYPLNLTVTPIVSWSLRMLSSIINTLHKMRTLNRRRRLSALKLNDIRNGIIEEVSSIPFFCKTVLLLESNEELYSLMSLTIITNSFLHKKSIGPWLIGLFHGDRHSKKRAVEFLEFVSNITVDNLVGGHRRWFQIDRDAFIQKRQETFTALAKLPGIIPALRILGKKRLEKATATHAVHYALNDRIGQPLTLGSLVFDGLLNFILLISYRFVALEVNANDERFSDYAFMLVFIPAGYFIARDILTIVSIIISSRRLLSLYIRNPWTMMDMISVVMALWTAATIKTKKEFDDAFAIAFTIVLLWFKFLGFLRYINRQLTTFISSFFEILSAMKWFFLVLVVAIMLFGDTVETILKFTPGSCIDGSSGPSDESDDMRAARDDFCSPHPWQSYIRIYSIVIGDVSLSDFQQTTFMTILFVSFTFFGIIVLLNILIAIVNDSYAKSLMRSQGLFGRARVELVVRQLAREYFTKPEEHIGKDLDDDEDNIVQKSVSTMRFVFKWFIVVLVVGITVVVEISLVMLTLRLYNEEYEGKGYFFAFFLAISILYSIALFLVILLCIDKIASVICFGNRPLAINRRLLKRLSRPLRQTFAVDNEVNSELDATDDWTGQLRYLELKTKQVVQLSEERLKSELKAEMRTSEDRQINKAVAFKNEMKKEIQSLHNMITQRQEN